MARESNSRQSAVRSSRSIELLAGYPLAPFLYRTQRAAIRLRVMQIGMLNAKL
jgi:hypothetical protein